MEEHFLIDIVAWASSKTEGFSRDDILENFSELEEWKKELLDHHLKNALENKNRMHQPLAYRVMDRFLNTGFQLKEDIIKRQYNCKATGFWVEKSKQNNFLLIMHEHLFVFQR